MSLAIPESLRNQADQALNFGGRFWKESADLGPFRLANRRGSTESTPVSSRDLETRLGDKVAQVDRLRGRESGRAFSIFG